MVFPITRISAVCLQKWDLDTASPVVGFFVNCVHLIDEGDPPDIGSGGTLYFTIGNPPLFSIVLTNPVKENLKFDVIIV